MSSYCFLMENNQLKKNEIKNIVDLDELPAPDFSQFSFNKYFINEKILPLQSARGCSWRRCAFCTHHQSYLNEYRQFSIKRIADIIKEYREKYKCKFIVFHDEEIPPKRAKELSDEIIKNGLYEMKYYAYARLVAGFNNALLEQMYKAGFRTISWGLESASDKILQLMRKGINAKVAETVLKISHRKGISNICWLIFGFPGENKDDALETIRFLKKNNANIDMVLISEFILEKGSPIYSKLEKSDNLNQFQNNYNVKELVDNIQVKDQLNMIKLTNREFKSFVFSNISRMLLFYLKSNRIVPYNKKKKQSDHNWYSNTIPIIIGKKINNRFYFRNINNSLMLDKVVKNGDNYIENKNSLIQNIVELCNGEYTIKEIVSMIGIQNIKVLKRVLDSAIENNAMFLKME